MSRHNAYRDGHIHVCAHMCETCIFRPGNMMQLHGGRVREMVDSSKKNESAIICHKTLGGDNLVCRGFFDRHETLPLKLARAFGLLRFQDPDNKET